MNMALNRISDTYQRIAGGALSWDAIILTGGRSGLLCKRLLLLLNHERVILADALESIHLAKVRGGLKLWRLNELHHLLPARSTLHRPKLRDCECPDGVCETPGFFKRHILQQCYSEPGTERITRASRVDFLHSKPWHVDHPVYGIDAATLGAHLKHNSFAL